MSAMAEPLNYGHGSRSGPQKLEWLEAMRGLAALWVLLHHAKLSVDYFVADMGHQPYFKHGYLGVDFFFVLSGFIIAFASHRLQVRGGGLREYFSARLIRIYVPYLPVGIGMLILYLMLPDLSHGGRSSSILTSLTLLPTNSPPALSVAWTLVHEMIFYTLFGLWFVHRLLFRVVFGGWILAILTFTVLSVELSLALRYLLSPLNLCFVFGVAIFHINERKEIGLQGAALFALAGAVVVASQALQANPNRVLVVIGFGCLLWAGASSATLERPVWRPLVVLGAASYSVYLIHNPVLSVLVRLLPDRVGAGVAFVVVSLGALLAGMVYWRFYEQPMLKLVRQKWNALFGLRGRTSGVGT